MPTVTSHVSINEKARDVAHCANVWVQTRQSHAPTLSEATLHSIEPLWKV